MRPIIALTCACWLSVIACSGDDGKNESTDDHDLADTDTVDSGDPDGDANDADPSDTDGSDAQTDDGPPVLLQPPARGFQVVSPELTLAAGPATAVCYYFRSANTEPVAVNRFVSVMTVGDYSLELYRTTDDILPPGSISTDVCSHAITGTDYPQWLYGHRGVDGQLNFPEHAVTGNPLALDIEPNTPMYLRIESSQATPSAVAFRVAVNAEALEAGTVYDKTAPYVMYNSSMSIPNNATAHVEASACNHSQTALFWMVTMHAHKQATKMRVLNDGYTMYESTDWEDPAPMLFSLYRFVGDMTYECTYANSTGRTVSDGESPVTDEVCKVMGYFFEEGDKAVAPRACYTPGDGRGFTFPAWP